MPRRMLIGGVLALTIVSVTASLAWACAPSGGLSLNPNSGPAGTTVTAAMSGFPAGENVAVHWQSLSGDVLGSGNGPTISVTIPASATPRVYTLVAATTDEHAVHTQAPAQFQVTGSTDPPPVTPPGATVPPTPPKATVSPTPPKATPISLTNPFGAVAPGVPALAATARRVGRKLRVRVRAAHDGSVRAALGRRRSPWTRVRAGRWRIVRVPLGTKRRLPRRVTVRVTLRTATGTVAMRRRVTVRGVR